MKSWCKVASNLDSHPKIRRAGRAGREVFLFALRRNAEPDNPVPGRLPAVMLEPWYLADQLMMSEEEAVTGVTACRHAGLLVQDGESWVISGWEGDWGKKPVDGSERTAKWRKKQEPKQSVTACDVTNVTESHRDESDVLDQRRLEEKKKGADKPRSPAKIPKPESNAHKPALDAFDEYFRGTHGGAKPTWNATTVAMLKTLTSKHGVFEIVRRLATLRSHPPKWPPTPWDLPTFVAHFDKCAPAQLTHSWTPPIA